MKKIGISLLILGMSGGFLFWFFGRDKAALPTGAPSQQPSGSAAEVSAGFDKQKNSLTDPASLWVVVNKQRPLDPQSFVPSDLVLPNVSQRIPGEETMKLRSEAARALEKLFEAAASQNLKLQITTAYRSYNYQKTLYDGYVKNQGQAAADTQSARPGYSEHQTGLAVDIRPQDGRCYLEACFGDTPEGVWLAQHTHEFGFTLRYLKDKASVTGYTYEPWHFRYVGLELAAELHKTGQTMEEFFGLPNAPDYTL